jgi:CubicO group peptidase (beta-lactamase class C family)
VADLQTLVQSFVDAGRADRRRRPGGPADRGRGPAGLPRGRGLDPWNVPGGYGWVGGTGTAAHVIPATGTVTILLTQREMTGPTPPTYMREFWRYAASTPSP